MVIFRFFFMASISLMFLPSAASVLPWRHSGLLLELVLSKNMSVLMIIWGVGCGWEHSGLQVMGDSGLNGQI